MFIKQPAIYIMANKCNGTLYTGVTSNLAQRVFQHKNNLLKGFTTYYDCKMLVYYELFDTMLAAIIREKQIKSGSRIKKITLIISKNPGWDDLYKEICD
jgi:putative endonuclease